MGWVELKKDTPMDEKKYMSIAWYGVRLAVEQSALSLPVDAPSLTQKK